MDEHPPVVPHLEEVSTSPNRTVDELRAGQTTWQSTRDSADLEDRRAAGRLDPPLASVHRLHLRFSSYLGCH
jgi:hypothetical protein